jgi:2-oxoisovalerate dehydrogenase E2 component (dihydrolipoyl transacylase)
MKIELPHVGESVTEGHISKWLKRVGDRVEKYDPLVEVVTDKVNMEMPSPVSGVLTNILVQEGQTVPMGTVIAEIQTAEDAGRVGEDSRPAPAPAAATPQAIDRIGVLLKDVAPVGPTGSGGPPVAAPEVGAGFKPAPTEGQPGRRVYSPVVQRLAAEHGIDLSKIIGTGIGGRVTRKDVEGYIEQMGKPKSAEPVGAGFKPAPTPARQPAPAAAADEERVPLTPVRRMIAEHMVRSATQIPAAWSIVEADVTGLVQRREAAKEDFQRREGVNLTYLPFVIKAVAESLKENPLLNSSWGGDAIILKKRINIGVAVAAPAGLVVPVIHDADRLSIAGLAKALDELTARARQGKLRLEDVQGGTFTVNNTGALGSVVSQPIINYPQAAILTTEAIVKRPVVIADAIAIRSMMNLCLTFDHRIMDGAESSAFINAVKRRLEAIGPATGIY